MKKTILRPYLKQFINYQAAHTVARDTSKELDCIIMVCKPVYVSDFIIVKEVTQLPDQQGTIFGIYMNGERITFRELRHALPEEKETQTNTVEQTT
jgi:hypothetical protein